MQSGLYSRYVKGLLLYEGVWKGSILSYNDTCMLNVYRLRPQLGIEPPTIEHSRAAHPALFITSNSLICYWLCTLETDLASECEKSHFQGHKI